jgi:hypothetical protein
MSLSHLLYLSYETYFLTSVDLERILASSVRNNTRLHLTGLLLYSRGSFMQLLEGEEEDVLNMWERLHRDPRHRDLRLLVYGPIAERSFSDWAMSFRVVEPRDAPEMGFSNFLFDTKNYRGGSAAFDYLLSFRDTLR